MRTALLFKLLVILSVVGCVGTGLGCGTVETTPEEPSTEQLISSGPHVVAVMQIRDLGTIRIELLPELAPVTVAHFSKQATDGVYDGTTFHRILPGYMIQGGDPLSKDNDPRNDGKGGGTGIPIESSAVKHVRGIVALAHRGARNSGGDQFFIMHGSAPYLDGNHSVFGRVIEGLEVLDAITEVEIDTYGRYGPEARPYPVDVVIESILIEPVKEASS